MDRTFLSTYLNDHLAGARASVGLLTDLIDRNTAPDLKRFFRELLPDITEDCRTLESLVERLHADPSTAKIVLSLVAERVAGLQLRGTTPGTILEALETLELGIRGKLAMWDALAALPHDRRVADLDLSRLRRRANTQLERVERERLTYAVLALAVEGPAPSIAENSRPPSAGSA